MNIEELKAQRKTLYAKMSELLDMVESRSDKSLTAAEHSRYEAMEKEFSELTKQIEAQAETRVDPMIQNMLAASSGTPVEEESRSLLTPEQRMADTVSVPHELRGVTLGDYMSGIVTGNWKSQELRNMAIGSGAAGGYLVPAPLSATVIDKARAASRIFQAGAVTVKMESNTLDMAKILQDPAVSFRNEAAAIGVSDMTLGQIQFKAQSAAAIIKFSRELAEDAQGFDAALQMSISGAVASLLDTTALYGSGVAPNPRGIKNVVGINTVSAGANGGQVSYGLILDAIQACMEANETPTAMLMAPRTDIGMSRLKDGQGQPLMAPQAVNDLRKFSTTAVPVNLTQGTANNASDIFVADFSKLMVGIRTELAVELLRERFSDNGEYGMLVWIRFDIQTAREKAFTVVSGIIP
ncbi:phage major capsid protein [Nitrolancea hollandica]|uniref:Putative Phage major capsid protein, HK97 family n=1 Tax=Nitrolancea hollandica Lb TaxID=1129897 RepID=I4EEV2_9BACT|nr:phage major capsid protein [Nitrolancea hollandica]CCF83214.1 putative Phage major capsid protein, HK97 family [Nitrolancea hollandica Lb]